MEGQMTIIVELAEINLADGCGEAELRAASDAFQADFLRHQPGFLGRELLRGAEGAFYDLVHWQDQASADAIMAAAMQSPACAAYFAVMRMEGDMASGVRHMARLAHYPG
jgi:hypothetical protein